MSHGAFLTEDHAQMCYDGRNPNGNFIDFMWFWPHFAVLENEVWSNFDSVETLKCLYLVWVLFLTTAF